MDIERINENTLKLFVSYTDIEERGFTKDEIWYNRDKGEELFWVMMEEVSEDDQFEIDGPLWIQVVAKDKGLEMTVTLAQMGKDGSGDFPFGMNGGKGNPFEQFTGNTEIADEDFEEFLEDEDPFLLKTESVFELREFDDIIGIAKHLPEDCNLPSALYKMEGKYYLYVRYADELDYELAKNYASILSEYATYAKTTIHLLEEYGKVIMAENIFSTVRNYF